MTILDVARWLGLSWATVKTVIQERLEKEYRRIGYRRLERIGIDELYLGPRQKYVTLVIDYESGRVVWVKEGRGGSALREFWRRLKISGARLKAVAMDMSGAYAASVREHAPHAVLTFDRFHVVKLMNEKLDDLRRQLVREAGDEEAGRTIKGLRWLLLHRQENLEKDARSRLDKALRLNEPLAKGYLLKEELNELWEQPNRIQAYQFLRHWCAEAKASGISQLAAMARTLRRHARNILSIYKTLMTSSKVEGINRKIRGLLASAYGIQDSEFFKLRLYALHETKWKLVG
jgi:transposase